MLTKSRATKRISTETIEDQRGTLNRVLEHDGIVYQKGDLISFKRERGRFAFLYWADSPSGKKVVTTWWTQGNSSGGYSQARSFYVDKIAGPKVKTKKQGRFLYCDDHPTYGAVRRPRTTCEACWVAYNALHGEIEDNESVAPERKVKKTRPAGKISGLTMEMIEDV